MATRNPPDGMGTGDGIAAAFIETRPDEARAALGGASRAPTLQPDDSLAIMKGAA